MRRIFKIMLMGDAAVGKTAIRYRYLEGGFKGNYKMTIGSDFGFKRVKINDQEVTVQIWDLAGQDRFRLSRGMYYKGVSACFLVFDNTRLDSLRNLDNWIDELLTNTNTTIPMVLIGNKSDLENAEKEKIDQLAEEYSAFFSKVWYEHTLLKNFCQDW